MFTSVKIYAHKRGEEVGPAGGETGEPPCLAEVHQLPKTAAIYFFNEGNINSSSQGCQVKKTKNFLSCFAPQFRIFISKLLYKL
jgi:hypothetical protein